MIGELMDDQIIIQQPIDFCLMMKSFHQHLPIWIIKEIKKKCVERAQHMRLWAIKERKRKVYREIFVASSAQGLESIDDLVLAVPLYYV